MPTLMISFARWVCGWLGCVVARGLITCFWLCVLVLKQATAVQDAIKGLRDGTIDAAAPIEIEGLETPEFKQAKADELAKKKVHARRPRRQ